MEEAVEVSISQGGGVRNEMLRAGLFSDGDSDLQACTVHISTGSKVCKHFLRS